MVADCSLWGFLATGEKYSPILGGSKVECCHCEHRCEYRVSDSDEHFEPQDDGPTLWRGVMFGAMAAIGYTLANVFLRGVAEYNSAWVSGMKSLWTFSLCLPWLLAPWIQGKKVLPSTRTTVALVVAACLGQFGGNLAFQFGLRAIGLAITVPLCLGTMITASAIIGRVWGGEPLKRSLLIAIPLFLAAIVLLSSGQMYVAAQEDLEVDDRSLVWVIAGCWSAGLSGLSYSVLGFAIRRSTHNEVPLVTPMAIVALVGAIGLSGIGGFQLGASGISEIPAKAWLGMSLAGIVNAAAFFSLTVSLKILPVLYVHLVNSSQVAMAAIAGALIFGEPITWLIGSGVMLTVLGFVAMTREPRKKRPGQVVPAMRQEATPRGLTDRSGDLENAIFNSEMDETGSSK
jgi:DME family drug/metabolite transporter